MQQRKPNQEPPIDLVEQFYKENVDLKTIIEKRKARKHISGTINKYSGDWTDAQKKHLLNRVLMGYAKYHLDDLKDLNLDQCIDLIFTQEEQLPLPVNDYYLEWPDERYEELNKNLGESEFKVTPVAPGEPWVESAFPGNVGPWDQYNSLKAFCIKHQLRQKTSIHWKLSFFIHNLLPTPFDSGASAKASWQYLRFLFKAPFQSYKQTIIDISKDPNMLWYLNLQFSRKDNPDENFAREIQELFTVGKGANAKYTESDVKAFSKIFVGWESDFLSHEKPGKILTRFTYWNHDTSDKQLSGFYGNKLIKGREGEAGAEEFDELMDIIFENKEVDYYISRRLYQFFVYPDIDQETENSIIEPMAKKFRESNFSLIETLKILLKSEHFYDSNNFNSMIKSPVEFIYGGLKSLGLQKEDFYSQFININYNTNTEFAVPDKYTNSITRDYYFYRNFQWYLENSGCLFGSPPSVSGWPPYYQAPDYDLFWINSKTISNRADLGKNLEWDLFIDSDDDNQSYIKLDLDYSKLIDEMTNPDDIDSVVDQFLETFITVEIGEAQKEDLKQIILNSVSSNHYTELYNNFKNNPSIENRNQLNHRFRKFMSRLFMMSEIHLF